VTQLFHANLTEMYARAVACLEGLIAQVASHTPSASDFGKARTTLEALPLDTEEAATARNRLDNARSYSEAGERGAARYELRLLARRLSSIEADAPSDRTRFTPGQGPS
jgi:hypothetical protein